MLLARAVPQPPSPPIYWVTRDGVPVLRKPENTKIYIKPYGLPKIDLNLKVYLEGAKK